MAVMAEGDGPSTERMPTAPVAPNCGGGNRLPVRHVDHQRDGAAMREEDMLDLVARSRDDRVLIERDRLSFGRQQIEVRWRQCCQKAVSHSAGTRHCR